jgi:hypothetical protein
MSTRKVIDIEVTLENGDKVIRQFEDLGNGVKKLADSNQKLDATFDEVFNGIAPLTTRMGEAEDRLYELSLAGDTASREYQELLTKVGQYRKVQIQTDLAVDQAAQTLSQKLGTALQGASSGFLAIQGIIGLTGTESEKLNETLLKVQSAMAFQQGISGLQEFSKQTGLAGKAMRIFNLIVSGNPFAIFATVLGSVIAGVVLFTDTLQPAIDAIKKFTDFIGLTDFAETKLAENRKQRHEEEMKRQKEEAEARKKAESELKALITSEEELLEAQGRSQQARNIKRRRLQEEANQALIDGDVATFNKIQVALIAIDKQEEQIYKDRVKRRLDAARQIEDLEIEIMDEGIKKELELNKVKFDRLIEDTKKNTELTAKERKRLVELFLFQQQEAENDIRNKFRQEELNAEENQILSLKDVVEQGNQLTLDGLKNQADKEIAISKNKNRKLEELEELSADRKRELAVNAASDTFSTLANLAELFAGESKKQQKKAFKVQKAANIAQATVDTFSSAIAAYKSQASIPVVGPVLGGIAAAAAVSAGLLNIKKISQQRFDSGGGTDGGGADFAPSGGGAQAPQFNVVGDSGINQLASLQQQPTQAFVVSGEVTTAQALDRNRVQNATL